MAAGLASDGWDLALSFWRAYDQRLGYEGAEEGPDQLAAELVATGARVELVPADLSQPDSPAVLIEDVVRRFGAVDALVLSHSESVDSTILTTSVESFDRHYAVNVRATWLLIKAFAQAPRPSGGSVVALTSDDAVGNLPYGATKAALDRVVLASAHELGDRGLRANVINPGPIDTGWMTQNFVTG